MEKIKRPTSPVLWNINPKWRPKDGEGYYYITHNLGVWKGMWNDRLSDEKDLLCGNIFKKEEEASKVRNAIARLVRRYAGHKYKKGEWVTI